MPRLGSIGEAGFEKCTPFFLEAEGVTHFLVFFVGILIGCEAHEYRYLREPLETVANSARGLLEPHYGDTTVVVE